MGTANSFPRDNEEPRLDCNIRGLRRVKLRQIWQCSLKIATASAPAAAAPALTASVSLGYPRARPPHYGLFRFLPQPRWLSLGPKIAGKRRLQRQHHHNAEKVENSLVQEGADDHPHQAEERRRVAHIHGADSHGERALEAIQNHPVERLVNLPGWRGLSERASKKSYAPRGR